MTGIMDGNLLGAEACTASTSVKLPPVSHVCWRLGFNRALLGGELFKGLSNNAPHNSSTTQLRGTGSPAGRLFTQKARGATCKARRCETQLGITL